ncbi:hypothetical protein [Saccharospirillum impatiens]|uniref:hypothetical protein n=1 Tax=Saccharospirillum impatiens TaxID=169438 RepID=UPI00041F6E92|nr:hypothetical protein [Saccharospirillum impatiens]
MIIYLVALALIVAGASTGLFTLLQGRVIQGRLRLYDAKGYWVVSMLTLTFLVTSLAYFWGVSRFAPSLEGGLELEAVVGMLTTVFGCIAGLGVGLVRFSKVKLAAGAANADGLK